jgi:hypothetical protein
MDVSGKSKDYRYSKSSGLRQIGNQPERFSAVSLV